MKDIRPQTTLFCAVIACAIAVSMLLRGRKASHWLFAAFAGDIACWYASQSLYGFFQNPAWSRVTELLTLLLPPLGIRLFLAVVPPIPGGWHASLARLCMVLGIPLLVLVLSPYHDTAWVHVGLYGYALGFLLAALIQLAQRGERSSSRAIRERVRLLVGVGGLAMTFTLADFLSFLGVTLPPIGAVLSIVFLFALAESVIRRRLTDLYELSGRLLVATVLAFCLAGIFLVFVSLIGPFRTMYLNGVLAATVFLVLFEPLQQQVSARIHSFFFRERYALAQHMTSLQRRLASTFTIEEAVTAVLDGLAGSRRVTRCAIYLHDQGGGHLERTGALGDDAPLHLDTSGMRSLLDMLHTTHAFSLEEAVRKEASTLQTAASTLGPLHRSVLVAIPGEQRRLLGLLCVADDRVRDAFSPEEILLLETLGVQLGIAVTNSRLYEERKQQDRLAALGAMAAGLAHEIKNPLGAIKGSAELLEEECPAGSLAREFVGIVLEETHRLNRVVDNFLTYARPQTPYAIPIDLNLVVRRTVQILRPLYASDGIALQMQLADALPRVRMDPERFRQVLMNLVQNAKQALAGEGSITVSTGVREHASWQEHPTQTAFKTSEHTSLSLSPYENKAHPQHFQEEGTPQQAETGKREQWVEVSVQDTGPGISQKVLHALFIPFFTTRAQGTGLGLPISQSIVQSAGGRIDVRTEDGAGTTFTILLPVAEEHWIHSCVSIHSCVWYMIFSMHNPSPPFQQRASHASCEKKPSCASQRMQQGKPRKPISKRGETESLAALLLRAGENRFAPQAMPVSPSLWVLVVGEQLASKTRPVSLKRGVLWVQTQSSVWASELSLHSMLLLERLQTHNLQVTQIRFVPGSSEACTRRIVSYEKEARLPLQPLPWDLQKALVSMDDLSCVCSCSRSGEGK